MKASIPPPYSLSHIYHVLARLGVLSALLQSLHTRLMREIILPAVAQSWRVQDSRTDTISVLRLQATPHQRSATDVLSDLSIIVTFITTTVFPPTNTTMADHESFCSALQIACLQAVLDHVIMAAMPPTMASVLFWLETIQAAVDFEASLIQSVPARAIILPFFNSKAGVAWASQRRRRVAEEVRRLILNGWGGWEAVEVERDKEVMTMVEVEVEEEAEDSARYDGAVQKDKKDKTDFEWGFEDERSRQREGISNVAATSETAVHVSDDDQNADDDGDGWAFGDENASAGPSKPHQSPHSRVNGDGWDFDEVVNPTTTPSKPHVVPKPAREAKRLGKKVAKAKTVVEDDVWASEPESTASSVLQNGDSPAIEPRDEWGYWADTSLSTARIDSSRRYSTTNAPAAKPRKKELQQKRRTVKERYMISRACGKLLEIAERVLREAHDTRSTQ